jgi:hypothetical protein
MNFVYFYRQLIEGHHIHKEFIYNNVFRNVPPLCHQNFHYSTDTKKMSTAKVMQIKIETVVLFAFKFKTSNVF